MLSEKQKGKELEKNNVNLPTEGNEAFTLIWKNTSVPGNIFMQRYQIGNT